MSCWRDNVKTNSTSLALCAGNHQWPMSPVDSLHKVSIIQNFYDVFDVSFIKQLSNIRAVSVLRPGRWYDVTVMISEVDKLFSDDGSLQWRYNGHNGVSNHHPHNCLLNRLFRRRSKKASKLRVTGPCAGNSPVTGEFPAKMASNAEFVSIWWRHHLKYCRGHAFCITGLGVGHRWSPYIKGQ